MYRMITVSTSRSEPKSYHHGDLREALIAAGLAMLEEGVEPAALSLREAARRAGVSAMAPYRHFADKEALLAAIATVGYQRFAAALRAADAVPRPHQSQSAQEALLAQGVAYVAFACTNRALFRLMFGAALATRHGVLAAAAEEAFTVLTQRVATLVEPAKVDDLALRCWATAHGLASLAVDGQLPNTRESAPAVAERILRLELPAGAG